MNNGWGQYNRINRSFEEEELKGNKINIRIRYIGKTVALYWMNGKEIVYQYTNEKTESEYGYKESESSNGDEKP